MKPAAVESHLPQVCNLRGIHSTLIFKLDLHFGPSDTTCQVSYLLYLQQLKCCHC